MRYNGNPNERTNAIKIVIMRSALFLLIITAIVATSVVLAQSDTVTEGK